MSNSTTTRIGNSELVDLSTLSIAELKAIALGLNCIIQGDKRSKKSWIAAIDAAREQLWDDAIEAPTTELVSFDDEPWDSTDICGESEPEDDDTTFDLSVEEQRAERDFNRDEYFRSIYQGASLSESCDIIVPTIPSSKPKAISVFALIFCLIGFVIQTTVVAICTILKYTILAGWYVSALFGKYNPSLDIVYQCQLLAAKRRQVAVA